MNFAHIKILAWEQFRRCLTTVIPVTVIAACLILSQFIFNAVTNLNMEGVGVVITLYATIFNLLILLVVMNSDKDFQFSMSTYYLRLPINAWLFAGTRIVLNCLTLLLSGGILLLLAGVSDPSEYYSTEPFNWRLYDSAPILGAILFAYLILQWVAWTFRTYIVTASIIVTFLATVIGFDWLMEHHAFDYGLAILLVVTVFLSGIRLRYARSDESLALFDTVHSFKDRGIAVFTPDTEQEERPFNSPQEAQRWLERRSMSTSLNKIYILLLVLLASWLVSQSEIHLSLSMSTLLHYGIIFIFSIGSVQGAWNGLLTYKRQIDPIKAFTFTKPISSRHIAIARMKASIHLVRTLVIILLGIFILYAVTVYPFDDSPNGTVLFHSEKPLMSLVTMAFSFIGIMIVLWCLTWLFHYFPLVVFLYIITICAVLIGHYILGFNGIRTITEKVAVMATLLIILYPIIKLWKDSHKQHLLVAPKWFLLFYPLVLAALYALFQIETTLNWNEEDFIIALYVAAMAYLPFTSVPMVIHWSRHR